MKIKLHTLFAVMIIFIFNGSNTMAQQATIVFGHQINANPCSGNGICDIGNGGVQATWDTFMNLGKVYATCTFNRTIAINNARFDTNAIKKGTCNLCTPRCPTCTYPFDSLYEFLQAIGDIIPANSYVNGGISANYQYSPSTDAVQLLFQIFLPGSKMRKKHHLTVAEKKQMLAETQKAVQQYASKHKKKK